MKILPRPKPQGQAAPRQQVGVIVSNKPPVAKEPFAGKELVKKPAIPPRPIKRVLSGVPRLASRSDIEQFVKFFDYSEILIREFQRRGDKQTARELRNDTINAGHAMFAKSTVQHFHWFERNPEKLANRSWWVLFDGYCIAAELYYKYDQPPISDGVFDKLGKVLYDKYPKQIELGFPEWEQYPREAFTPANAHAIHRNSLHLGVASRIAHVVNTGPKLAPPPPRPTIQRGIKSRWA